MAKMMGKNRRFGRCPVKCHSHCEVSEEIQRQPIGRAAEKRKWVREFQVDFSEESLSACSPVSEARARYIKHLAEAALAEAQSVTECICQGSWRSLNERYSADFQRKCVDRNGKEWVFIGLMIGECDYYYVVWSKEETQFLSCVGCLGAGGWEFIFADEPPKSFEIDL